MNRGGVSPKTGMARAEAYEWVVALRAAGWTGRQIAAELDVSASYVHDLLYDPTGEKARARKQRALMRPCVACGEPTWGERCEPCQTAARHAACYWTDERCLEAAREWRRRYGAWPTTTAWRRAQTLDGYRYPVLSYCYDSGPKSPGHSYKRPWRSWAAFLVAAGADPDDVGMARAIRAGTAALRGRRKDAAA